MISGILWIRPLISFISEKNQIPFEVPGTLGVICDFASWQEFYREKEGFIPLISNEQLQEMDAKQVFFLTVNAEKKIPETLLEYPKAILVLETKYDNKTQLFRKAAN